ncbi:hypothetical protein LTR36_010016 [Oleoguttula mirabilis]|uniref:Uncharacterized protein n=1 Tax=Oleoguttula mirabilis TaxID=1507867 RepID=A0AAV9JSW2_9PEZI|nr:hypothetical protein LTR36_010016 [Oleoguttula mirabilis]
MSFDLDQFSSTPSAWSDTHLPQHPIIRTVKATPDVIVTSRSDANTINLVGVFNFDTLAELQSNIAALDSQHHEAAYARAVQYAERMTAAMEQGTLRLQQNELAQETYAKLSRLDLWLEDQDQGRLWVQQDEREHAVMLRSADGDDDAEAAADDSNDIGAGVDDDDYSEEAPELEWDIADVGLAEEDADAYGLELHLETELIRRSTSRRRFWRRRVLRR